jgi:hypothetical protein
MSLALELGDLSLEVCGVAISDHQPIGATQASRDCHADTAGADDHSERLARSRVQ